MTQEHKILSCGNELDLLSKIQEIEYLCGKCKEHMRETASLNDYELSEERHGFTDRDQIVILAHPENGTILCTKQDAIKALNCDVSFPECDSIFDEKLFVSFNEHDEVIFGNSHYVIGNMMLEETDDDGYSCNVNRKTFSNFFDYVSANKTFIEVDGMRIAAFRISE